MIVYRFEKNGIGPYVNNTPMTMTTWRAKVRNKKAQKKVDRIRLKLGVDVLLWQKAHQDRTLLYGCPSKEALRAFFGYTFKPLFAEGYRIKKYKVPDDKVINMGLECAFPVKYHTMRTKKKLEKTVNKIRGY